MSKSFLFQTIRFNISTQFISFWPIDRALSGATTPGQSRLGRVGNEGLLSILQRSSITGTSPLDFLVSDPGHSLVVSFPSAEVQSVYSTALADWTKERNYKTGEGWAPPSYSYSRRAIWLEPSQTKQATLVLSDTTLVNKNYFS